MLASTVKLAEKGFEICAVDEQAKGLLQTVEQVAGQLEDAKALRSQKSAHFNDFEKRMFEDTFRHTEDAIYHVATIAERPRVDMEVSGGKLRMNSRILYVLRDSPSIQVSLSQLGIASQALNAAIVQLNSRGSGEMAINSYLTPPGSPPMTDGTPPLPTYDQSVKEFFSEGRRKNLHRRASALALANGPPIVDDFIRPSSSLSAPIQTMPILPELDVAELSGDMYHKNTSLPEGLPKPGYHDPYTRPRRRLSYRLSTDLSIPEVVVPSKQQELSTMFPSQAESRSSSVDLNQRYMQCSSTAPGRVSGNGKKTGRARAHSWLESRALQ